MDNLGTEKEDEETVGKRLSKSIKYGKKKLNNRQKITPYLYWTSDMEEALVRLVGEYIRQNKYMRCVNGTKEIDWELIAKQMNDLYGCQISTIQAKNKWHRMVSRLPKAQFGEEKDQSEMIRYIYIFLKK